MNRSSTTAWRKVGHAGLATAAAAALTAAVIAPPASAATGAGAESGVLAKTLKGEVGPGFTISINKSSVPAGKYKLVVTDKSSIHNFHITGAGVDEMTTVPFTGKKTFKIKLRPGTYEIVCDPHSGSMNTTLTVT